MEWATGIKFVDGRLQAEIHLSVGRTQLVDVADLAIRGLPTHCAAKRRRLVTDFASWDTCSIREYTSAFGGTANAGCHQVFRVADKEHQYLIPVLALMRGLFRPNREVLPAMFLPQGLERISTPIVTNGTCQATPITRWKPGTRLVPSLLAPIAWLHSFPSANRMCASIGAHALDGQIGMQLPKGAARMVVRGLVVQATTYVTQVKMIALDTDEQPYEYAKSNSRRIVFHESAISAVLHGSRHPTRDDAVPLNSCGTTTLSDSEWAAIQPILRSSHVNGWEQVHDLRLLLNGVLHKLATGHTWKSVPYTAGTWVNASNLLQNMKKSGKWVDVLKTLRTFR